MNRSTLLVLVLALVILTTTACGPSQEQLDATYTQAAVDLSGTQTAQAPTATFTLTPSPTATETPTITPKPTYTPTSTPTPLPKWMSASLTLEDLPAGFEPMADEALSALQQNMPPDSIAFGFSDEANYQAVLGYFIRYPSQSEQDAFDMLQPQMLELFATAYGAATTPEMLSGLDEIGESRAASTFVSSGEEIDTRWDLILFRRGEIGVLLFVLFPDGETPAVPSADLALLLDQRVAQALSIDTLTAVADSREDFNTDIVAPWKWLNEKPSEWDLTERPGYLRIFASHDKNLNYLLRPVSKGDFTIETYILFEPKTNFQFAGLVVYQDVNNTLSFGRAFCDVANSCVGNGIYFDNVQGGSWTGVNFSTSVDNYSEAFLRLERRGDNFIGFYSPDGITWFKIGTHQVPAGFQANGVGLFSINDFDTSDADIPAYFDYFELSEYK